MKIKIKILSIIACLAILLSAISISAFSEAPYDYPPYDDIVTDGLSNVIYGTVGSYESYKIQVGSVIPYSFFKNLFLSYNNGANADIGSEKMLFNIFCEYNGTLQPMFTTDLSPSIGIYTWNAPYNNNDRNLAIVAGAGANEIWVTCDNKPKFTISQDSDGYLYFKYTDSDYLKSVRTYSDGNLFLIYAPDWQSYQDMVADCQRYYNNDSFIENESMYGATADFITFPKTSNNIGALPVYLKSWLADGYQYPYLEFYIDSNSTHQSYQLVVSSNSLDLFGKGKSADTGLALYVGDFYSTGSISNDIKNISNSLDLVPDVPVNPSWTENTYNAFINDTVCVQRKLNSLKKPLEFSQEAIISTYSLDFSTTDDRVRYFSICLSDYLTVKDSDIYKIQIVNTNDSTVLATTYFASYDEFLRNTTPVGDSHAIGYPDRATFDKDASNGSYTSGTRSDLNAINSNDTPSISPNTNLYNNIGNGDFFSALDSTLKGLQGFFYGCYSIIPPAIISIILGSLAIIVVMRVLGR